MIFPNAQDRRTGPTSHRNNHSHFVRVYAFWLHALLIYAHSVKLPKHIVYQMNHSSGNDAVLKQKIQDSALPISSFTYLEHERQSTKLGLGSIQHMQSVSKDQDGFPILELRSQSPTDWTYLNPLRNGTLLDCEYRSPTISSSTRQQLVLSDLPSTTHMEDRLRSYCQMCTTHPVSLVTFCYSTRCT